MARGWRGALAAVALLVVVLAGAFAAYGAHGERPAPASETAVVADAASGRGAASGSATSDRMLLADHDATVYDASGLPTTLTALAVGRPLVINFWATWCPYCLAEMPDYQAIHADYADRVTFAFVDVADGRRETVEGATAWLAESGYDSLPVYFDTELAAVSSLGVWSYPTSVVVNGDGEIRALSPGAIDPGRMRSVLDGLVT